MKAVIKEYATTGIALISTCLILAVFGCLIFHQDGLFTKLIQMVLKGGV